VLCTSVEAVVTAVTVVAGTSSWTLAVSLRDPAGPTLVATSVRYHDDGTVSKLPGGVVATSSRADCIISGGVDDVSAADDRVTIADRGLGSRWAPPPASTGALVQLDDLWTASPASGPDLLTLLPRDLASRSTLGVSAGVKDRSMYSA